MWLIHAGTSVCLPVLLRRAWTMPNPCFVQEKAKLKAVFEGLGWCDGFCRV